MFQKHACYLAGSTPWAPCGLGLYEFFPKAPAASVLHVFLTPRLHLSFGRHRHRGRMLGRVADDWKKDDANEGA